MAEPGEDDVFSDDITVPATDGYPLAATLFLPRGAKRHAVLINSATAVPRKLYRGFAGYLAKRGCAVLTYDYRGTGDSRQQALTGYNQPKSLVGFKASMSDWAAQDITAAVAWMRERYKALPFAYVGHSFGGQALGLLAEQFGDFARAVHCSPSRLLEADGLAGALPRLRDAEFYRPPPHPRARLHARQGRPRHGFAEGRVSAMGRLGDEPALSVRRFQARSPAEFSEIPGRVARALHVRRSLGDAARGRIAVLGVYLDQARDRHGDARRYRREQDRPHGLLPARTSRHAVARVRRNGSRRGSSSLSAQHHELL